MTDPVPTWRLRETVLREARGHIEGRRSFEEHQLGGRKSSKPLTKIELDPHDVVRLLEEPTQPREMWMAVVYQTHDRNPGSFAVRSIEKSEHEAEQVLRREKPDLLFKQVVADFSYEAVAGGLTYEVLRVQVAR